MWMLARLNRVRVAARLAIMMAVILALAMAVFTATALLQQRRTALDHAVRYSARLCETVRRALRISMLENRREELYSVMADIAREQDIVHISMANYDGRVAYSTAPSERNATIPLSDARCRGCHVTAESRPLEELPVRASHDRDRKGQTLSAVMPIYNAPDCSSGACHAHPKERRVLGVMGITLSTKHIDDSLNRARVEIVAVTFALILATFVGVWLLVRRWVGQPVQELLNETRRIGPDSPLRILQPGEAELGELARAFNSMQERLFTTHRKLLMSERLAVVGKLAAGVAHEINNPLTGVLSFAESLIEDSPDGDPRRKDYEVIRHEAMRCRDIVRNLLDFARQQHHEPVPTQLNRVVEQTLKLVSRQASLKDIEIITKLAPNLPAVVADPAQMEQVFLNLLVNACDAMPDGGRINIASGYNVASQQAWVAVSDTGHGMDPATLGRIFEPFFSTKMGRSSGLGLSVSWGIVQQHGGRLEVESEEGQGTTFRVVIPAVPESTATPSTSEGAADA